MRFQTWLGASALLVGLTGCVSVYRVDNQVESFARWTGGAATATATGAPAAPQSYRFERLPSQSSLGANGQAHAELETLVQTALVPLGWTVADTADPAAWRIQVEAQSNRLAQAPWESHWDGAGFGWMGGLHIGVGHRGNGFGYGVGYGYPLWALQDRTYFQRQVSLLIRDSATGRVVYETQAAHDGRWNSSPALWQAMVSAALAGFPTPPSGVRQVNLDVPR